ncbi:50S ribosomal protein L30 [candidate division KSB1 bacterium]
MTAKKKDSGKSIKIKQVKSAIGYNKKQKLTIEALGIHKLGQTVEHKDTPQIRGMINKVSHLVKILEEN